jgi:coenzyme F420-reducing hydrogenase beta subunit/polysaccharide pyruvyl transferase WcaK-like protein
MTINPFRGLIEPVLDLQRCVQCGLCVQVCPGWQLDIDSLRPTPESIDLETNGGELSAAFIGCSFNDGVRVSAASGGMVSEVLIYLLDQGLVDGAIVTRMNSQHPLKAETFIARSREEILSAQKSKYCPVAVCSILKEVLASEERYAFVGLPCHVAGVRKVATSNQKLADSLPYILGLFCSRTPNAHATRHLLYNLSIDPHDVQSIDYRGNGHPGKLRIRKKNGTETVIDHLDYKYWGYTFFKFFKPIRCWLCPDHSAKLADMSFADNWTGLAPFKRDNKGSSTIVARMPEYKELLLRMADEGRISLHPIPEHIVVTSQDLINKSNVSPRLWIWRKLGKISPDYSKYGKNQPQVKDILSAIPEFLRIIITTCYHNPLLMNSAIRIFWISERMLTCIWRIAKKIWKIPIFILTALKTVSFSRTDAVQRSGNHKIVMIGGFGGHDIGDEAMPHADRLNLRANINNLDIVMCSPDPEYTSKFHGERSIHDITGLSCSRTADLTTKFQVTASTLLFLLGTFAERMGLHMRLWPTARLFLDEIACADLLFNVGGGNLTSVIPTELYKKCTTYLAARILKKPIILSGQTIGPFTKRRDAQYACFCMNHVNLITFRDKEISHQRLRAIGVSKPIMLDAADDAITIPLIPQEEAKRLLRSHASASWWNLQSSLIVVMNLKGSLKIFKGEGRSSGLEREVNLMAMIADKLVDVCGAKIFFLPTDYCPGVDDREVHRDILARMKFALQAISIEDEYDDINLKGIIALADVAIGVRYHFAVFAASVLVPFLGIASGVYQQTKLKGRADLCELPQCFVPDDMEFAIFDQVWPKIQRVISERNLIVDQLSRRVPILKKHSLIAVEEAVKIISSKSS